jgi:ankyrin repeat protein
VLLDHGAEIDALSNMKQTPLHLAVRSKENETILLLLDHGARINACDNQGRMPLHLAAISGECESVLKLLDPGADINAPMCVMEADK